MMICTMYAMCMNVCVFIHLFPMIFNPLSQLLEAEHPGVYMFVLFGCGILGLGFLSSVPLQLT